MPGFDSRNIKWQILAANKMAQLFRCFGSHFAMIMKQNQRSSKAETAESQSLHRGTKLLYIELQPGLCFVNIFYALENQYQYLNIFKNIFLTIILVYL